MLSLIIGSTYVCSTGFVSSPSTVAVFVILSPLSKSFTLTVNSRFLTSPGPKSTFIPLDNSSSVNSFLASFPITILSSTNVVPVGTSSLTIAVVGAVPLLLSNVIVYVISSSIFTSAPSCGSAVFVNSRLGLCTSIVSSFVGSSSTYAVFIIVLSNTSSPNSSTVTTKVTVSVEFLSTFTSIPVSNSFSSY